MTSSMLAFTINFSVETMVALVKFKTEDESRDTVIYFVNN